MLLNPLAVEVVEWMWIGGVEENPLNGHLSPISMVSIRNSTMLQERSWPATGLLSTSQRLHTAGENM
jgi:hypothetical protein